MNLFHRAFEGAGSTPVVILHGFLGSSRNWQTVGRDLAARGPVFALDLRNHGQSPRAESMSFGELADDVVGWIDGRFDEPVHLLGHSLGGKVAMRIGCRFPRSVERLTVVDIAPKAYAANRHSAELDAMLGLDLGTLPGRAEADRALEPAIPDWGLRQFLLTNLERGPEGRWRWSIPLEILRESAPHLTENALEETDRFEGPARFVVGAGSDYVGPDDAARIRHHFPEARIVSIPGAGHNPHTENRAAFVAAVLSD